MAFLVEQTSHFHSPSFMENMLPHPDPTGGADGAGAEAGKEGNATGAASEASIGLFSREEDPFRPPVSLLGMKSYGTAPESCCQVQ